MVLPILLIITLVLVFPTNGKPFFFQQRPGKNGKLFRIVKFRTMNNHKVNDTLLPDAQRLTKIGRFIRSRSIDELPQLLNVLFGHMSLIGPRPLLPEYMPLYNERQSKRHQVRPGITGLAQVNGRNMLSWNEKFDLDVYYVEHLNFLLDCKIFWLTVKNLARPKGISSATSATMEKFTGNAQT